MLALPRPWGSQFEQAVPITIRAPLQRFNEVANCTRRYGCPIATSQRVALSIMNSGRYDCFVTPIVAQLLPKMQEEFAKIGATIELNT